MKVTGVWDSSKPEGLRLEHGEFPRLLEQVCTTSVASTADACSPVGLKPRCRQSHALSAPGEHPCLPSSHF